MNGPVGQYWDGKVWIPPFGFDPFAQAITYRMFPREAWAFTDYCVRNAFNPVRVEFPEGGGRWFGIKVSLTTIFDNILVGEISRSWTMPTGQVPPVPHTFPDSVQEICFPGVLMPRGVPELVEWCFHQGRAFTFHKPPGAGVTWFKVLDRTPPGVHC